MYGTLRHGCRNSVLMAGATPLGRGLVAGVLHEVAAPLAGRAYSYPVLVVPGPFRVVVEVYRVVDADQLASIDALEAYDPDDPAGSEYLRVRVPLLQHAPAGPGPEPAGGTVEVQAYVHAGGPGGLGAVLPGGDWCACAAPLG